jgi:putative flippase GtrA
MFFLKHGDAAVAVPQLSITARLQCCRFCAVGLLGYLVNLSVYSVLTGDAAFAPLSAATAGFSVAVMHNHFLNRVWTFRERDASYLRQGGRFLIVSLVALAVNLLVLRALLVGGLGHLLAQALAIGVAMPVGFLGNRKWTFRSGP